MITHKYSSTDRETGYSPVKLVYLKIQLFTEPEEEEVFILPLAEIIYRKISSTKNCKI